MPHSLSPTSRPTWKRYLWNKWVLIALLLLAAWLLRHFFHKDSEAGGFGGGPGGPFGGRGGRNITTVGVAAAEKADLPIVMNALGTVTATATVTVRPQVSGVLQQVNFKEGQMVKAGQVLALIDPRQYELALMQSSGQLQRDLAQLENARQVLKRDLVLQSQESIAQQDVEAQSTLVKQLEGTVMTDRAQEGNARLNLSYTKVLAPVSGRVGLRTLDVGNLVSANDATGIAVITQLAPIDIEFTVPQTQVGDIQAELAEQAGSPLNVSALDRSRATVLAEGQFLALDNQVDIQTGTVRAKARFANADNHLFPNQFVNLRLVVRTIRNAVVVPVAALRHGTNGDYVYVLDPESKTVAQRAVTLGQAEVERVQIASGLAVGEKVITEGADRLKDGAKVNLPGDPMPGPGAPGDEKRKRWQNGGANSSDQKAGDGKKWDGQKREGGQPDWQKRRREHQAQGESPQGAPQGEAGAPTRGQTSSAQPQEPSPAQSAAQSSASGEASSTGEHRHKRRAESQ